MRLLRFTSKQKKKKGAKGFTLNHLALLLILKGSNS